MKIGFAPKRFRSTLRFGASDFARRRARVPFTLNEAPPMYKVWRDKKDNVTKIVIDPWATKKAA